MSKFNLTITTPERVLISGEVTRVLCKNALGEFEILAGHQPYITATTPTVTRVDDENGESKYLFTSTGLMKVQDNEVTFCVNSAEWPEEIDQARAMEAKQRAEERLKKIADETDVKRAKLALARAMSRLKLKEM
ncbi:F0F1 ATP synthase subunit epsilon [Clostridium sp. LIBA-8841]|uniref:F0F1 ATP synthase subunit epsilon n=1 Tax=Clostridium sp. LIBA-8841 TaxID=2987530 RepID=UPI002AC74961|nr:F0F1 ATP synthase subunit epsilon [Clostridium sp. LIBA-8841]MDZ5253136.1 F0F1 ATP synthase subunit epsilon [Clostridium sp. LIBA-8841]